MLQRKASHFNGRSGHNLRAIEALALGPRSQEDDDPAPIYRRRSFQIANDRRIAFRLSTVIDTDALQEIYWVNTIEQNGSDQDRLAQC